MTGLTKTTFAALVLVAALPASAASPEDRAEPRQPPQPTPTIRVFTRETVVDVTVTDANGRPVHGLKRSDFAVAEDGKPQPIRSFREFQRSASSPALTPHMLPPDVYTNFQPSTSPLNILLFDDINGGGDGQARLEAAKFIREMSPGTRIALLGLGDRLTVLQGPTSDPAPLLKVVNAYIKPFAVEAIGCTKQVAVDWATLDELRQLAQYLSGVSGRKNLLWIGVGNTDITHVNLSPCQDWRLPLQQTYDLLEDAQATIYPLDPRGVGELGLRQLSLEAVAEATGGAAYYQNNDLKSLMAKAVDLGSSYYTLSYASPTLANDGSYHAIRITADRPDLRLVYRKGYSLEDPAQVMHPPESVLGIKTRAAKPAAPLNPIAFAMAPVAPPATQLLFDARITPVPGSGPETTADAAPRRSLTSPGKESSPYGVLFALPASQIAFVQSPGGAYSGSLEFDAAAYNSDGKIVSLVSQTMKLPLTAEEYASFLKQPFQFFQQIDLPPGPVTLRVGILDGVSNKVGTLEIPLTVPKPAAPSASAAPAPAPH